MGIAARCLGLNRDRVKFSVPYAPLSDCRLSERHYGVGEAPQDHPLDAVIVV